LAQRRAPAIHDAAPPAVESGGFAFKSTIGLAKVVASTPG
jgi:hypothetical protein